MTYERVVVFRELEMKHGALPGNGPLSIGPTQTFLMHAKKLAVKANELGKKGLTVKEVEFAKEWNSQAGDMEISISLICEMRNVPSPSTNESEKEGVK